MGVQSLVPVAAILVPIVGAVVVYVAGVARRTLAGPSAAILLTITFVLCAWTAAMVLLGGRSQIPLTAAENGFLAIYVDALSALLIGIVGLLGLLSVLFSLPALPALIARGHGSEERLPLYYALLTLFVGTMIWACSANNIVILWMAVEATTLASALLVAFYWDRRALEAGYKYLLLLTIGITFALFGCVLLYSAASSLFGPSAPLKPMMISEITRNAAELAKHAPSVVAAAVVMLVIGFGTKAGLVPMHAWLPDAHSEAPAPVSVLLSGIVIKVGAYALARCALPFLPIVPGVAAAVLFLAAVGMIGGIAACAAQDDLKRLLAYSSVSQIGYVIMGLGLGSALAIFGGLFHLLNHALAKALLFFSAGAIENATGERSISKLGGLRRAMPYTAVAFFVGALALGGVPGLNGFLSKLTIFLAAADARAWWAATVAVITGLLTLVVLVRCGVKVFFGEPRAPAGSSGQPTEVAGSMALALVVLAILCVILGVWPPVADSLVRPAADALQSVMPVAKAVASLPTQ
ncbi:MAG: oxidoreductase [Armatimonadetes bacterium]|nr:oxidoreductase [Armatimonadota bacterium]